MRKVFLLTAVVGVLLAAGDVHAQRAYPTKPIRLIVPFAPGGGTDIVARVMAQKLTESFGTPVVVDNRPGAAGTIGTETGVRANPDGYTMVMQSASYAAIAALYKLPYDPVNDVAPIALIGETGYVVALHPSVPVKSIKELIAYDKAHPGKLHFGSSGIGGSTHLVAELFNQTAGTKMTHVPYKGIGAALNDLLGAQIQLVIAGFPPMIPQVRANRLRGVAVTTARRSDAVPDIPTVAETVPGFEAIQWFAVFGPKALPKDIVARWNREIDRVLQMPDMKERMVGEGMEPVGGPPERFRAVLAREIPKWQKVVRTAGIRPGS